MTPQSAKPKTGAKNIFSGVALSGLNTFAFREVFARILEISVVGWLLSHLSKSELIFIEGGSDAENFAALLAVLAVLCG